MRKAGLFLLLVAVGLLFAPSCAKKRDVTIELLDPCVQQGKSFRSAAKYVEFVVFPNSCPDDKQLAAGDTHGARYHATVPASANLPDVGDLPKSKFGFAVILRDAKCSVIGFGCTEADLENISGIRVAACDWSDVGGDGQPSCSCAPLQTGGGCAPPAVCVDGQCKGTGEGDAGGCSLAITAAGALPDPIAPGANVTGPAIAAIDNGFVLAYRDQSGAVLRARVGYLTDGGVLQEPGLYNLTDADAGCTAQADDGVSIAYAGGHGLVASSLPNCAPLGAGAVFIPFDGTANAGQASGPRNTAFNDLKMAQGPALAPAAVSDQYELLYKVTQTGGTVVERVVLQGAGFKDPPALAHPFGDSDQNKFGMVATTPSVRAYLAPDAVAGTTTVLVGTNISDTFDQKGTFGLPIAEWAAITAWDNRVAAAVPASVGMTLSVGELGSTDVSTPVNKGLVGGGTVTGGALAALRSHLFLAEGQSGKITVLRLENAKGTILTTPAGSVDLTGSLGDINLSTFDGSHIAMAAARNLVAVVWLSKSKLGTNDPTGGWALLRCGN